MRAAGDRRLAFTQSRRLHAAPHPSGGHHHQHRQGCAGACAAARPQLEGGDPQPVRVVACWLEGQHQHQGLEVRASAVRLLRLHLLSAACLPARYVQLGATSTIKGESDQRKYEKVRARRVVRTRGCAKLTRSAGTRAQEAHRQHPHGLQEDDEVQGHVGGALACCRPLLCVLLSALYVVAGPARCDHLPRRQACTPRWRREGRGPSRHSRRLHAAGNAPRGCAIGAALTVLLCRLATCSASRRTR